MYQDFITDQLRKATPCIIIQNYSSKEYQYRHGESATGIEIKYDSLFHQTGNLYIEIAEKSDSGLQNFTPSGVMRDDNTWLYLIGDYQQAFLFGKGQLRLFVCDEAKHRKRGLCKKTTPTSIGVLFPIEKVLSNGMCLHHYVFDNTEKGERNNDATGVRDETDGLDRTGIRNFEAIHPRRESRFAV